MFKLINQIRFRLLESKLERLEKEDDCLRISCDKCKYLRLSNEHYQQFTCKREYILRQIERLKNLNSVNQEY